MPKNPHDFFSKDNRIAVLVLQDSSFYAGLGLGASKTCEGELVFNTSMTGYQEILTDPSYSGQIINFCYPLIGNYGFSQNAFESKKIHAQGVVVKEACPMPFNAQYYNGKNTQSLDEFLCEHGIPGIQGMDTRNAVLHIRESGVLPAKLKVFEENEIKTHQDAAQAAEELSQTLKNFNYSAQNFVSVASQKNQVQYGNPQAKKHAVLIDFGSKQSIANAMVQTGARVTSVPWNYSSKQIMDLKPDGVLLSNGPGDPALLTQNIETIRELLGKIPIFGVCLGHQLLAHALGAQTYKLKFGHRGGNHPVMHLDSRKVFITSQNHGFAVKNLPSQVEPLFENCYDQTNEGIKCASQAAFSVQFHPEANPGPHDTSFLFQQFYEML